jgi:hypothetical protein
VPIADIKEVENERVKYAQELELINKATIGSELKMVSLKNEIEELKKKTSDLERK